MKIVYTMLALFVVLVIIPMGLISFDGLHDRDGQADVAVVLGATVNADGTMSSFLKGRVDAALKLYNDELDFPFKSGELLLKCNDRSKSIETTRI